MTHSLPSLPISGEEAKAGWSKFPVSRPLNRPVVVIHEGAVKEGFGCECRRTGGAIRVDGKLINSNHLAWWKYA